MKTMFIHGSEDKLIRCESMRYSVTIDAELEQYGVTPPELVYYKIPVKKRTPKGAWIDDWKSFNGVRFVLLTARKQYASETEEEALSQFVFRKRSQVRILSTKLERAKEDYELGKRSQGK